MPSFEELIFAVYGQHKSYDELRHNLLRTRHLMRHHFSGMTEQKIFNICCTICLIVTSTVNHHMNENKPISKPKDIKHPYSINEYYEEPNKISVGDRAAR